MGQLPEGEASPEPWRCWQLEVGPRACVLACGPVVRVQESPPCVENARLVALALWSTFLSPWLWPSVASKPRAEVSVSDFASLGGLYSGPHSVPGDRAEGGGSWEDWIYLPGTPSILRRLRGSGYPSAVHGVRAREIPQMVGLLYPFFTLRPVGLEFWQILIMVVKRAYWTFAMYLVCLRQRVTVSHVLRHLILIPTLWGGILSVSFYRGLERFKYLVQGHWPRKWGNVPVNPISGLKVHVYNCCLESVHYYEAWEMDSVYDGLMGSNDSKAPTMCQHLAIPSLFNH